MRVLNNFKKEIMTIKKILLLLCSGSIVLFAILFVACSSEDTGYSVPDSQLVTLYTGDKMDGLSTRTTINEAGEVIWSASDIIFVNGAPSTKTTVSKLGAYAEFSANTNAPYAAVYPASMVVDYTPYGDGWLYKIILQPSQPYKNTISFADGVNPSIAYSENESLTFQNLCGILQVQVKANALGARKVRFVSKDNSVSGLANVYVNSSSANQSIEIVNGKKIMDVVFDFDRTFSEYVPMNISWVLPTGIYEAGCTVSLLDSEDNILAGRTLDRFTIARSKKTDLGELDLSL